MRRLVRVDRRLSKRGDGATARVFFSRAVSFGRRPGEVTTDRAPIYPRVLDDVVPSARQVVEQHANDVMEADAALLKVRRGPVGFGVSGSRATTERSGSDPLEPDAIVSWPAPARSHHG
jgi:transposase-like protein